MVDEQTGLEEAQTSLDEGDEELDDKAKLKEAIDVSMEDAGTLRKKLTITVPRDAIDERLRDQFAELRRDAQVPGFRKGKAPLVLVEKRFGGEVGDQLVAQLVSSSYLAAVEKVDIKPLGDPLVWIESEGGDTNLVSIDKAVLDMKLPAEGALEFSCEVELKPEFTLPELDDIPVENPKVSISDDDVQGEIDRLRSMRGRYVPVDGKIEKDDLVVADVVMKVGGEVVKEEENVQLAARPQVYSNISIENLGEVLEGKKADDSVTVKVTIGDDYSNLAHRGQEAEFAITVRDVKRIEIPPLDDELIEMAGFDNEAEMREQFKEALEARLDSVIKRGMRGQIGKYLTEKTEMELPTGMSQRQIDRVVARRKVELLQAGMPEAEVDKHTDELRAKATEETVTELKLFFIMEKIAEDMEIDVADEELNGAIASIAGQQGMRFDRVRDQLSKGEGLVSLYLQLRDDKILDVLLTKAKITEVEGPKTKKPAKAAAGGKKAKKKTAKKAKSADSDIEST